MQEAQEAYVHPPSRHSKGISPVSAATAWKQIQNRMKPPKCKGHNEDCVIRQVKKKGPNLGPRFCRSHNLNTN